ncbi:MAG TPA: aminotransferase class IV [Dermatophilaceae bacterium]|jgi:branched-chain amino acid aminotransferase|nr:aminotransferase class IV [Actinomycetales bacterium]HMT31252.1 aminotransferase class IV [Dermatophilaceae bacterium]HMT91222.1 aminotransferase class IV [Dermatophilaceae bacterium]
MPQLVWVDGHLRDGSSPSVPALDHGLVVGDGVFESTKVMDGHAFALTRHLARMDRSLAGLGLPPADHDQIREGVGAVLAATPGMPLGKLRWWVTGGLGPLGSDREAHGIRLRYHVAAAPIARRPDSTAVHVVPWTRNERAATAGLKTTSYADNVIALAAAHRAGASEALFANTRGELAEGTGSNVFVVIDGVALTPPLASGALAGVTRGLVVEWAAAAGLPIREADLPMSVLAEADEVFLTSSTRDVQAVHAVDDRRLDPGPVTAAIAAVFADRAAQLVDP